MKNLTEEGVIGKDLNNVEAADIKDWGVINFGDKKQLFMYIKNLIKNRAGNNNNDDDNIAAVANEEGAMSGGHYR